MNHVRGRFAARWLVPALLALGLIADAEPRAAACGGPEYALLSGLEGFPVGPGEVAPEDDYETGFPRDELRFVYPFRKQNPRAFGPLWDFSYESAQGSEPASPKAAVPSLSGMEAAIAAGDLSGAEKQALAVVNAFYALPPVVAAPHVRTEFWPAVEVLDVMQAKHLPRADVVAFLDRRTTHLPSIELTSALAARPAFEAGAPLPLGNVPLRAASIAFVELQRHFASDVPNGWSREVAQKIPLGKIPELERAVNDWERQYPKHPLRDLVELWRVRVALFTGQPARAWQVAFAMYPRRPVRAVAEMRYLLQLGIQPSPAQIDALKDPVLVTAFATKELVNQARFDRWLALAKSKPREPWSDNLQERLLYWASIPAGQGPQPKPMSLADLKAIPSRTPFARKLVAAVAMKVGETALAEAELLALPQDGERGTMLTNLYDRSGRYLELLAVPDGSGDSQDYVIRLKLSDAELAQVATSGKDWQRDAARTELARRHVQAGRWKEAALQIDRTALDGASKALWKKMAELGESKAPDAELKFAAFLESNVDSLLDLPRGLYRAMGDDDKNAKSPGPIELMLRRSSNRWLELELYAKWLGAHQSDKRAREVLALADRAYARLVNTAGGDYYFWGRNAKKTALAAELRKLGATIRAGKTR